VPTAASEASETRRRQQWTASCDRRGGAVGPRCDADRRWTDPRRRADAHARRSRPSDDDAVDARLAVIDAWPEVGRAVRSAVETAIVGLLAAQADRSIAAWLSPRPLETVAVNGLLAARDPDGAARHAAASRKPGTRA
jgi:hypothetical protein